MIRFIKKHKVAILVLLLAELLFIYARTSPPAKAIVVTTPELPIQVGEVTSAMILDGTIVNADVSGTAAIATSKLATSSALDLLTNGAQTISGAKTWSNTSTFSGSAVLGGTARSTWPTGALLSATSTIVTLSNSVATTTLFSMVVPSSTLTGTSAVRILAKVSTTLAAATDVTFLTLTYGSSTVVNQALDYATCCSGGPQTFTGTIEFVIGATDSNIAQWGEAITNLSNINASATGTLLIATTGGGNYLLRGVVTGSSSVSATSSQNIVLLGKHNNAAAGLGITVSSYIAEILAP